MVRCEQYWVLNTVTVIIWTMKLYMILAHFQGLSSIPIERYSNDFCEFWCRINYDTNIIKYDLIFLFWNRYTGSGIFWVLLFICTTKQWRHLWKMMSNFKKKMGQKLWKSKLFQMAWNGEKIDRNWFLDLLATTPSPP